MESKRMNMEEEKEDRISSLPDSILQHILSLLPSTKQAIQTGILSKRWENQWTQIPVLIFDSTGMSYENFLRFIDNTLILHDCAKIDKFHLKYCYSDRKDPQFSSKIRFATRKYVDELYLYSSTNVQEYKLPNFLFNNASLAILTTVNCIFMPNGKVSWQYLTTLSMVRCKFGDEAMELVLSGSPLLEKLSLGNCFGFNNLAIASKSLKILVFEQFLNIFYIEISCPKLDRLWLHGCCNVRTAKLLNLPSSLSANIEFKHHEDQCNEIRISLTRDILQQLQHVKELTIGSWLLEFLSQTQVGDHLSPALHIKGLTLRSHNISGIACLLRNSPVLEKLSINVTFYDQDYRDFGENYWSDATVYNCLVSHLKTIKIIGFPKRDDKHKVMLNFVQFFLKNAKVLEKLVVQLKDDGTDFPSKVSQELLSLPRFSQYAIIELICCK
ncbi:putative F-box/LRR-repeat protein At3g18150 [Euphorbia lathyris]|uniref:putative F-box/LRR-repeat protein At3g18150 n=1 Tax=Euphorbia lathyris TaxID=212925 RepID=UPI0033142356